MKIQEQLVPKHLLEKADKILFVTHLALGDFTYMQNCFKAFKEHYPHIKIDLWVDEVRRSWKFWQWRGLKRYVLHDWLQSCSLFNKIYKETYTPGLFKQSIRQARAENYSIVISLTQIRQYNYAAYAKRISPKGFVAGVIKPLKKYQLIRWYKCRKLDAALVADIKKDYPGKHISDIYADWFERLFGMTIEPEKRVPFISFPRKWSYFGKLKFLKWGIHKKDRAGQKTIFINAFAKNRKRCWPINNVFELISQLQTDTAFYDARFIVNVLPEEYKYYQESLKHFSVKQIFLFTADFDFFQLPAVMSNCDFVISVETGTVHFAAALKIPVIVLMRQKNPEWVPLGTKYSVIYAKESAGWVKNIQVADVVPVVHDFVNNL